MKLPVFYQHKMFRAFTCSVKKVKIIIVGILVIRVKIITMETAVHVAKTEIYQTWQPETCVNFINQSNYQNL
jgi:hypothetical protein